MYEPLLSERAQSVHSNYVAIVLTNDYVGSPSQMLTHPGLDARECSYDIRRGPRRTYSSSNARIATIVLYFPVASGARKRGTDEAREKHAPVDSLQKQEDTRARAETCSATTRPRRLPTACLLQM